MTITITNLTESLVLSNQYDQSLTTLRIIAIALLIGVLLHKELLRAKESSASRLKLQVFNIAIVPLLFMFGVIIVVRLLDAA